MWKLGQLLRVVSTVVILLVTKEVWPERDVSPSYQFVRFCCLLGETER